MISERTFKSAYVPDISSINQWILTELRMNTQQYDVLHVEARSSSGNLTKRTPLPIVDGALNCFTKEKVVLVVQVRTQCMERCGRISNSETLKLCLAACVETEKLRQLLQRNGGACITLKDIEEMPNSTAQPPTVYSKEASVKYSSDFIEAPRFHELVSTRLKLVSSLAAAKKDHSAIQSVAVEAENLYGSSPSLDLLCLQLTCACLCIGDVDFKDDFLRYEAMLFSERMKLRGLTPDALVQQHKKNLTDEMRVTSFHFFSIPSRNEQLLDAVNRALKSWNSQ